jgi:6-phosphogluconate dehydrogenase
MQLAMIGLGRMGGNMVQRLLQGGHEVVVYDRSADAVKPHVAMGASAAKDLADLSARLKAPRVVWIMVPAGAPVESTIDQLLPALAKGDVIIDGGNSNYKDSVRRAAKVKERGVEFIDSGTSGGIWGLTVGYCLMIGASPEAFRRCEPIFKTLAPPEGYAHVGPPGAGHYVKMVHNGIEYGLLQAYAEGWELLEAADLTDNVTEVFRSWREGTVIRSWLLDLMVTALDDDPGLSKVAGYAEDSGEGRWTVEAGIDNAVATPAITAALYARFISRQDDSPAMKAIAAMRNQFGGHAVQSGPPPGGDASPA